MNNIKYLLIYPFVIFFDIIECIYKLLSNILYRLKRKEYNYSDIVAIEYFEFSIASDETFFVYNKKLYTPQKEDKIKYDKFIKMNNEEFKKIIRKLKQNKILKYNYTFSFYLTPIEWLWGTDGIIDEKVLTIFFKDNKKHNINSNCDCKAINNVVSYIKSI